MHLCDHIFPIILSLVAFSVLITTSKYRIDDLVEKHTQEAIRSEWEICQCDLIRFTNMHEKKPIVDMNMYCSLPVLNFTTLIDAPSLKYDPVWKTNLNQTCYVPHDKTGYPQFYRPVYGMGDIKSPWVAGIALGISGLIISFLAFIVVTIVTIVSCVRNQRGV